MHSFHYVCGFRQNSASHREGQLVSKSTRIPIVYLYALTEIHFKGFLSHFSANVSQN